MKCFTSLEISLWSLKGGRDTPRRDKDIKDTTVLKKALER